MGHREKNEKQKSDGAKDTGKYDGAKFLDWCPCFVMALLNDQEPRHKVTLRSSVTNRNADSLFIVCG